MQINIRFPFHGNILNKINNFIKNKDYLISSSKDNLTPLFTKKEIFKEINRLNSKTS
jgi:hypothetical protein